MFDGAARGNPGPGRGGVVLYASSVEGARGKIWEGLEFFGHSRTNNEAEYLALIFGVWEVVRKFLGYGVHIEGDSALVVNQIRGTFRAQSSRLVPLWAAALRLLDQICGWTDL